LKITGGNAEVAENRGVVKRAIRKLVQGKKLEIDAGKEGADLPQRHRED
jgi:hypothetical protein